ncbi:hypothetical protein HY992_01710 [Candidatus Micrarchaeota archaeon]|nr:hypothetical protein [Candidatus Micrarchaeota archaeon]
MSEEEDPVSPKTRPVLKQEALKQEVVLSPFRSWLEVQRCSSSLEDS